MKKIENLSIVVQWDEVDDSLTTTYTVTWTSERDHILHHDAIIEQSSYIISGLTLDTVYTITVTAANRCGQGPEYRTSVSLITDASSTIANISTNTVTIPVASPSSVTTSTVQHVLTASTTVMNPNTTAIKPITTTASTIANVTGMITVTETTKLKTTIVSMNPIDVTGMITVTKTTEHKTTIVSTNPSAVITTSSTSYNTSTAIGTVMSSTSTVHITDTTTANEISKFSSINI